MERSYKVSVTIITYNQKKFVSQALDSSMMQEKQNSSKLQKESVSLLIGNFKEKHDFYFSR